MSCHTRQANTGFPICKKQGEFLHGVFGNTPQLDNNKGILCSGQIADFFRHIRTIYAVLLMPSPVSEDGISRTVQYAGTPITQFNYKPFNFSFFQHR